MKRLLDDYNFSDTLRYEKHHLIYTYSQTEEPIQIGGFLGAALLCALLINSDEGNLREIPLDIERKPEFLFERYDQEAIPSDWGYLSAEINQLNSAFIQLTVGNINLTDLCPNMRQLSIASDLVITYMQRLVKEECCEHIWEIAKWRMPFAQWLFDAGYVETRRQRLLNMDWTDAAEVNALVEIPEKTEEPTFIFEGEDAKDILRRYWEWLWATAQQEAASYPDEKVVIADIKATILEHETNYDFLKPEMKPFTPNQLNTFRNWMTQWTDFVQQKIKPLNPARKKKEEEQLFFPDDTLKCPTDDDPEKYAAAREYITERKKYDPDFRKFMKNVSHARLCRQLTMLFGWYVDPSSLRKSLLRSPKRKTKKYT